MNTASKNYIVPALYRAFFLFILILGGLVLVAQSSRSLTLKFPQGNDIRLSGVETSGWTDKSFEFIDPDLIAGSVKIGFAFETARPSSAGPATIEFEVNGEKIPVQSVSRDPIYLTPKSWGKTVSIKATVTNPFISSDTQEERGVKISRIVISKSPLIIPALSLLLPIAGAMTLLGLLLWEALQRHSASFGTRSVMFAATYLPLGYLFAVNYFSQWHVSLWLLLPLCVFIAGFLIPGAAAVDQEVVLTQKKSTSKFLYLGLGVVFIFALWIRISTVSFGLPDIYHPDEARKLNIMRSMILSGNLDPDYFRHPSFMIYSGALVGKIFSVLNNVAGPTLTELAPLARSVSAVFGALTIFVMYLIGSLLFGRIAGFITAVTIAICPLHVVCSRYVKEDVCMMFFLLLTLLFALKVIYQKNSSVWLITVGGFITGIAASIKYTGILASPFLIAPTLVFLLAKFSFQVPFVSALVADAQKLPIQQKNLKQILIATVCGLLLIPVGFLLITPYSVINTDRFIKDFLFESHHMANGHSAVITAVDYFWSFHLHTSVFRAFGFGATWIAILGLGILCARKNIAALVPLLGVLLFYLPAEWVNAKPFPQAERYILPALPFLALSVGYFLQMFFTQARTKVILPLAAAICILLPPALFSISNQQEMMHDTRQESKEWVEKNIPHGTKIVTDWFFYGPPLSTTDYVISELKTPENAEILRSISVKTLQDTGAKYFITSSFFYDRYLLMADRGHKTGLAYQEIFSQLPVEAEFSRDNSGHYGFHNPTIKVFKIPQ